MLAGALALGLATPAAAQFGNVYFFGDSLTDAGSFRPVLPPGMGLFTTNPGPVWATVLAGNYGFTATPANQGGNDFAQGGARVTQLPGVPNLPPTGNATPVATQVSQLIARGPLDPNALYFVWAGANDLFFQLGLADAGVIDASQVQASVTTAASQVPQLVAALSAAGARYIIVMNLPDIGRTPSGAASGQASTISALSSLFNTALIAGLDAAGVQTLRLNIAGLLDEIAANPGLYGLTNVTSPACGARTSLLCTAANLVAPNAAQTFLFADGVHPTTAGHAIVAQYAQAAIMAPQQVSALAEAPMAVESANWRALDARMISAIAAPRRSKVETWVSYDYGNPDMNSGFLSGEAKLDTVAAGIDFKVTDRLLVGTALGYTDDRIDFSQSGFKLKETTGTAYGGYGMGPWYVGGSVGGSDLDYRDVHRDIQLGATTRSESGTTKGYGKTARVVAGYWFKYANLLHGPSLRFTYNDIKVRAYCEEGSASTTMCFDQQRRRSKVSSIGWQVSGAFGALRPFARASWEHEIEDDERSVGASIVGMGGHFVVPTWRPDTDYGLYTIGASTDIGRVTAFVDASATSNRSDGNAYGATVGVRIPL